MPATPLPTAAAGTPALGLVAIEPPAARVAPLPDDLAVRSRNVKGVGYFLGADAVGVCALPEYAVYSHDRFGQPVECDHPNAVVIAVDQGYRTLNASNGHDWISGAQSFRGYSLSAFIAYGVASYIRRLGYRARVHHARNYQVIVPPLLVLAGLGEMARPGVVVNPFLGMRFKAAVVTTDMPLAHDRPVDFGLQDFCRKCKRCAIECPSKAISLDDEKIVRNGYETWAFNADRCTKFRVTNPNGASCGTCVKACPWNKPPGWTHDLVRWLIPRAPILNGAFVKLDALLGSGRPNRDERWWLDLEEVDGEHRIPGSSPFPREEGGQGG